MVTSPLRVKKLYEVVEHFLNAEDNLLESDNLTPVPRGSAGVNCCLRVLACLNSCITSPAVRYYKPDNSSGLGRRPLFLAQR